MGHIMARNWFSFLKDDRAATAVEYVLVVSLIGAAVMAAITIFGEGVSTAFESSAQKMETATGSM